MLRLPLQSDLERPLFIAVTTDKCTEDFAIKYVWTHNLLASVRKLTLSEGTGLKIRLMAALAMTLSAIPAHADCGIHKSVFRFRKLNSPNLNDYKKEFISIKDNANLVIPEASFRYCSVDELEEADGFIQEMIGFLKGNPPEHSSARTITDAQAILYRLRVTIHDKKRFGR
jgi:hypothetical protein